MGRPCAHRVAHSPISRHLALLSVLLLACSAPPPVRADWQRQSVQQLQQTTLNTTETASFQRTSLDAVAATGITASAPLIQQGQWNPAVTYSPAVEGGTFQLQLTQQRADPAPPASFSAISAVASERSASTAANQLQVTVQPDGSLRAGPGTSASEVQLSVTQTYSVFSR